MTTDVKAFLEDLNGGVFEEKLSAALSDCAANVVSHGKAGKVTLTFTIEQIGNSHQVAVKHNLKFMRPTIRGSVTEEDETQTPMFVGRGGAMTVFAEDQNHLFDKHGDPINNPQED